MVSIVINHVMGAYPIIVIWNLVFAQIHLDVNLEGCLVGRMDVWIVIQVYIYARYMVPFFFIKIIRYQKRNQKVGNHIGIIIGSMVSEYLGFFYTTFTIILIKIDTHFLVKSYVLEICNISFIVFCYCIVHMGNILFILLLKLEE
jgi:hypothetical protein